MSKKIQSFRDLRVYQASFDLQQQVFEITKRFPKDETCCLLACKYIPQQTHDALLAKCRDIGKMLGSMMAKPEKFCRTSD